MHSHASCVISIFIYGVSDYKELVFRTSFHLLLVPYCNNTIKKKMLCPLITLKRTNSNSNEQQCSPFIEIRLGDLSHLL